MGNRGSSSPERPALSIVIPCYRSGPWMAELVDRIDAATTQHLGNRELILVDDASPDEVTWAAIRKAAQSRDWVQGVQLQFNVGQFRALLAALSRARGEWVVTLDDDLQTPPEEIPKLLAAIPQHPDADAIIGAYTTKRHSALRNLGTRLVSLLFRRLYDKPAGLATTSFRALRRSLVATLLSHDTRRPVMGALILQSTRRIVNVPLRHAPRTRGASGYTFTRLVSATMDNVFASSTAPLRAISLVGFSVAAASIVLSAFYFARWLQGAITEPGFPTLVLLLTFGIGLILGSIGVVGEYVLRVVREVAGPPRWSVREVVGAGAMEDEPRG